PDSEGRYQLGGTYVFMENLPDPTPKGPTSKDGRFVYGAKDPRFLNVMAYHHIDRFQEYVQTTLGLAEYADLNVGVDVQDGSNDRSSWGVQGICFGLGQVPDASDALIILHEYGHALQNHAVKGSASGNFTGGVREGFADFLAAVFYDDAHVDPKKTRGIMFSWGANPGNRRCYSVPWRVNDPGLGADGYKRGQVWCATMFELYRKLGGDSSHKAVREAARALSIRLHLKANKGLLPDNASATEAGTLVLQED